MTLAFRLLPWEYAIRNLFRRPLRTTLTFAGLTTVIVLVFVVVGFVRGLDRSLTVSGDPRTAILFSLGMGENLEYSSIPMSTTDLVPASVSGIQERFGQKYVSPELYLGTLVNLGREAGGERQVATGDSRTETLTRDARPGASPDSGLSSVGSNMGLVRGVTRSSLLVRRHVEIEDGDWPQSGEVMIGRMAAAKFGATAQQARIGQFLSFEGRSWRISGVFSAGGAAFESEVWCRLDELQQAMKRQDLSLVALTLAPQGDFSDIDLFCKERRHLELRAMRETDYYAGLQEHYRPVRWLAWLVVLLVSGAGVFAGLNTMYGSVVGRIAELATLQTIGFVRRAIVVSLIQEGVLLAAGASLLAALTALVLVNGAVVRFTMGAFSLNIDGMAVLTGCGTGLSLGLFGAIPPAIRALRMPVVDGLKAV